MNNHKLFGVMTQLNVFQQIATLTVIRSFGNLVTCTDEMISYNINETGVLLIMIDYLDSKRLEILTRNDSTCWMRNITGGTQEQAVKILNLDIIPLFKQIFVEIVQVISYTSACGFVQNSQANICDQSGCRIILFPFYDFFVFVFVLFCFFF